MIHKSNPHPNPVLPHATAPAAAPAAVEPVDGEDEPVRVRARGRLLRWLQRDEAAGWGTDPGLYDADAVQQTIDRAAWLFGEGRYFGLDVRGLDNIPAAPVMLVSNHSGGTTIPDVWGFGVAWYRYFGARRPIHPMAHEFVLSTRVTAQYFGRRGVVRADRRVGLDVLRRWRRDLMVMPGGDLDTWRPYSQRYQVRFGGRTGYARLALKAGVPIVPVANAGAHETLIVLSDGKRIARALRLHDIARASIFPVHLSLPWGLTVGPWPHLPTPTTLRYRIGAPISMAAELPARWRTRGDGEPPEELVRALDEKVRCAVQDQLDGLRRDDEAAR